MPFGNGRRSDVKGRAPARLQRSKDWNDPLLAPQRSGPPPLRFSQTAGNLTHPSQAAKQPSSQHQTRPTRGQALSEDAG